MASETLKLYKVTLRTTAVNFSPLSMAYVVATDPTSAYARMRESLKKRLWTNERSLELDHIDLIAECAHDPNCQTCLYLPGEY